MMIDGELGARSRGGLASPAPAPLISADEVAVARFLGGDLVQRHRGSSAPQSALWRRLRVKSADRRSMQLVDLDAEVQALRVIHMSIAGLRVWDRRHCRTVSNPHSVGPDPRARPLHHSPTGRIRVLDFRLGLFPKRPESHALTTRRKYTLNYLPIGGFVRLEGEETDSDDPRAFTNSSLPKQVIVLAAGVAIVLLVAVLIFFVVA